MSPGTGSSDTYVIPVAVFKREAVMREINISIGINAEQNSG